MLLRADVGCITTVESILLLYETSSGVLHYGVGFCFTELTIKQEEEPAEEADNRSPALKEIGQTGEEEAALEESMTGSPNIEQDGLSGPNVTAEAGSRQPNGTDECISTLH